MLIKKTELTNCLSAVADIADYYESTHLEADNIERSVDNLILTCSTYLKKEIEKFELEIAKEESPVLGCCIVSAADGHYIICYVQDLNYCWKRFVICKEVFHAVLDDVKYHNMSIDTHVDEVTVTCSP